MMYFLTFEHDWTEFFFYQIQLYKLEYKVRCTERCDFFFFLTNVTILVPSRIKSSRLPGVKTL